MENWIFIFDSQVERIVEKMKKQEFSEIRKSIDEIVSSVGSPYGEGATYESGAIANHMDENERKIMAEDIMKVFESKLSLVKKEARSEPQQTWTDKQEARAYQRGYRAGLRHLGRLMKREMDEWHKHEQSGLEHRIG